MNKQRSTCTFKVLLIGFCWLPVAVSVIAQEAGPIPSDTLQHDLPSALDMLKSNVSAGQVIAVDSLGKKKFISGVELLVDYGKLLSLWTEFESKYEGGMNIRFFERLVLSTEIGRSELNPLKAYDNTLFYTVKGSYARVGLDYYTSYDPKSFYYIGFRYAGSIFEDEGAFLLGSDFWEDFQEGFGSTDIEATWAEIILGTETFLKIGKKKAEDGDHSKSKLMVGWKFRLRLLLDFENREELRIYSIPGYGRTFDNAVPAINFYLKYRLGN